MPKVREDCDENDDHCIYAKSCVESCCIIALPCPDTFSHPASRWSIGIRDLVLTYNYPHCQSGIRSGTKSAFTELLLDILTRMQSEQVDDRNDACCITKLCVSADDNAAQLLR